MVNFQCVSLFSISILDHPLKILNLHFFAVPELLDALIVVEILRVLKLLVTKRCEFVMYSTSDCTTRRILDLSDSSEKIFALYLLRLL